MSTRHNRHRGKASHAKKNNTKSANTAKSAKAVSQVRIIGGQFKRQWVPFIDADGLRPSPDRLRETLFNWLQFELHDTKVLDLCAGSGVLGFEALSRGARHVTFIELQPKQAQLISQTAQKLKLDATRYDVHLGDALTVINKLAPSPILIASNATSEQVTSEQATLKLSTSKVSASEQAISEQAQLLQKNNKATPVDVKCNLSDLSSDSDAADHALFRDNLNADTSANHDVYQVVFIDPPYDLNLWVPMLDRLIKQQLIDSDSLLYIEDRRPLSETLTGFAPQYTPLKSVKVGQIFASLIQVQL